MERAAGDVAESWPTRRKAIGLVLLLLALIIAWVVGERSRPPAAPLEYFDQCEPGVAPDEACYSSKRDPTSPNVALATEIAHRYIAEHAAAELSWSWRTGVLMYALTELYRVTGDPVIRDYYRAYIDHHIWKGYVIAESNDCPPVLAALAEYRDTGDGRYAEVIDDAMYYLLERAPRTTEGGISHGGTRREQRTLWIDSLFMFGMVLDRWGELGSDCRALDEMGEQLDVFADLLQDPRSGLLVHVHGGSIPQDPEVYWARGNAWAFQGVVDYLRVRRLRHERDERAERIFADQLAGILETQDESGGWWTVMNRPGETYLETSATGFFGYGMARAYRYGLVGDEALGPIAAAVEHVRSTIVRDAMGRPVVTGTSQPTGVGGFDFYANVPVGDDISYGLGATITILIETSGLPLRDQ